MHFRIALFCTLISATHGLAQESGSPFLPSQTQSEFLQSLETESSHWAGTGVFERNSYSLDFFPEREVIAGESGGITTGRNTNERPFAARGSILIQFAPAASSEAISGIISEYGLAVIDADSRIGLVVAQIDGSRQETKTTGLGIADDGLQDLISSIERQPQVVSVSANTLLTPFLFSDSIIPRDAAPDPSAASEKTDWGILDAKIDKVWPQTAGDHLIGVIDVGFSEHEDLQLIPAFLKPVEGNDHGNHVSGIICGLHNGIGIRGAVPNCSVVYSSGNDLLSEGSGYLQIEDGNIIGFYALFSELVSTVLDFMESHPDVKVINLSLGYNWIPNFGIDPSGEQQAQIRDLVRAQGRIFASVLAYAKARNVIIVSAAGNDSSLFENGLDSTWASPFNFGSQVVELVDGWSNGIVVEAHDQNGIRAAFSNVNGDITAPGVDIYSSLSSSPSSYGVMSGTSMASPYVTGVVGLLQRKFNTLTAEDITRCLLRARLDPSSGVAVLDAAASFDLCQSM